MKDVHTNVDYLRIEMDGTFNVVACIVHKHLMEICWCIELDTGGSLE